MAKASQAGMTLIELVVALAVASAMLTIGLVTFGDFATDQRVKSSARAVADAFLLARGEAIRTGSQHIVAFDIETGLAGISSDIVIANDGPPNTANCRIDASEIVHSVALQTEVTYGTNSAGGSAAPDDIGGSGNQATGSSFEDADNPSGDASWVLFQPDGVPRLFSENAGAPPPCDAVGRTGKGGGAIYVTNQRRDYAVVLSALGAVRVHHWLPDGAAWSN